MPRLTKTPWFGPKRVAGWGLTPVSWQGWVATVVYVILDLVVVRVLWTTTASVFVVALLTMAFVALALLTGTAPGGPKR